MSALIELMGKLKDMNEETYQAVEGLRFDAEELEDWDDGVNVAEWPRFESSPKAEAAYWNWEEAQDEVVEAYASHFEDLVATCLSDKENEAVEDCVYADPDALGDEFYDWFRNYRDGLDMRGYADFPFPTGPSPRMMHISG